VGGDPRGQAAAFGRFVAKIPAKRVPAAVTRIVSLYEAARRDGEPLLDYLKRVDPKLLAKELADLASLDAGNATEDDFVDYAETTEFRVIDEE
jgi:sulfite reductase beta subunit-like hemoprotein